MVLFYSLEPPETIHYIAKMIFITKIEWKKKVTVANLAVQYVARIAAGTVFSSIHFTAAIHSNSWSAPSAGADVSYDQIEQVC